MNNTSRFLVVDALRGFAIVSIMLLHNLEHFDFYFSPQGLPEWVQTLDGGIWKTMFFLFSGKSYAIFSLLFGLTFFIQTHNREKQGKDFRGRFAWRLVLLLLFGIINSAFYEGDILTIYALIGFGLIPFARMCDKAVFWIAVILMLQPYEWINFILALQHPDISVADPLSWSYFGRMGEYITGDSIIQTWIGNLTNGKAAVFIWSWEQGRVFQTLSLFMFGMLAGRKKLFALNDENKKFWMKALIISAIVFIPMFYIKLNLREWISSTAVRRPFATIEVSLTNMAFMMVLVSGFILLFHTKFMYKTLNKLSPMGMMSLSNYMIQSLVGSIIYYGFGFGLYKYTGASYCLLIGIVLAIFQGYFSSWWMKHHQRGPLETIWHKLTWIRSK